MTPANVTLNFIYADGTLKVKEEQLFSEVMLYPGEFETVSVSDKLRVHSPSQLLYSEEYDPSSYCISENEDDIKNSIIVEVKSITDEDEPIPADGQRHRCRPGPHAGSGGDGRRSLHRRCKSGADAQSSSKTPAPKTLKRVKFAPVRLTKAEKAARAKMLANQPFRKILPAPAPVKQSLLPAPMASPGATPPTAVKYPISSKAYKSTQDMLSTGSVSASASYQVIKMPGNQPFCPDISTELPQVLCPPETVMDEFCQNAGIVLNSPATTPQLSSTSTADLSRLNGNEMPGNIFLLNPTSRVMFMNSDVAPDPIYTLTSGNPSAAPIGSKLTPIPIVQRPNLLNISDLSAVIKHTTDVNRTNVKKQKVPPVGTQLAKFRKIAPLPATSTSQ